MSQTTITFDGTTYDIEVEGEIFVGQGVITLPGDAIIRSTFGENGSEFVNNGGLSDGNTFSGINSSLTLEAGASSYQDTFTGGSEGDIYGIAWNLSLPLDGDIYVESGGIVRSGQFSVGSVENILAGAQDFYSTITGNNHVGGEQAVIGTATGVTVGNGGEQITGSGGVAYYTVDDSGGELLGDSGGTFSNFQIKKSASAELYSGSALWGGTVAGKLDINSGATASGTVTIENGGLVSIPYADILSQGSTAGAELMLTGTSLSLSQPTDTTLDSTGILTVGSTAITFAGGANSVLLETPLANGIEITQGAACFVAGTRIAVVRGGVSREVAVESLVVGDQVVLGTAECTTNAAGLFHYREGVDGRVKPGHDGFVDGRTGAVKWIGKRRLDLRKHSNRQAVLPVLFEAGCISDGLPARELLVSPDHALFFDGYLIPAKALVNGHTIRQVAPAAVTYYHVELSKHAVIFAEGVAAESYLETGNRGAFENGGGAIALHPDFAQRMREAKGCAPFAEFGPVVEAVRQRLLDRANIRTTHDPAFRVEYRGNGDAVLSSRSGVPGELTHDPRDRRLLGVKIAAIEIAGREGGA